MRAATNENVDTIFIVAISKNLAVFLSVIFHLTMILNTTRTAIIVFVIHENDLDCNLQQSIWLGATRNVPQNSPNKKDKKNS